MLDFDPAREAVAPKDAATVIVLRDGDDGPEVFCVRRHAKSAFMGGAVVFPGGKLDADDGELPSDGVHPRVAEMVTEHASAQALANAACRETFEEAAILLTKPLLGHADVVALRRELETTSLAELLARESLTLATAQLVPFARWVTPEAEQRRYDARFFIARAPREQRGAHDDHETTHSVWARPERMLAAAEVGDVFLAPPTVRVLELLTVASDVASAVALAAEQTLAPICPHFVAGDPPFLALPGDPAHPVAERRVAGPTRFVMVDGQFRGVDPPP